MKKSDLRSGMIVRTRNNSLYMVLLGTGITSPIPATDVLWRSGGRWMPLSEYDEDMLNHNENDLDFLGATDESICREFDIMEVYTPRYAADIGKLNDNELIYQREE